MKKELINGMYVICPINTDYLTKGKEYKVMDVRECANKTAKYFFRVKDDKSVKIDCLLNICSHINFKSWIIK